MRGELVAQDVEQHELLGREELGRAQVRCEGQPGHEAAQGGGRGEERLQDAGPAARVRRLSAQPEEARDERVRHGLVQLREVARGVD